MRLFSEASVLEKSLRKLQLWVLKIWSHLHLWTAAKYIDFIVKIILKLLVTIIIVKIKVVEETKAVYKLGV